MSQIDKWNAKRKHPRGRKKVKDKTTVNNVPLVHVPSLPQSMTVEDIKVTGNLNLGVLGDVAPTTPYLLGTDPDGGGGIIPVLQSSSSLTDNVAPTGSPTPTVTGGQRWLAIKFPTQVNADIVTYEVHIGTSGVFVADASTLVAETKTNLIFVRKADAAGTNLAYGTDYYVRIIAKDDDGAAAPSAAVGPTRLDPNATDDYTAGSITAEKFAAVMALVSALSAGVPLAERVEVGFGTKDDGAGNQVIDEDFIGIRAYEEDGTSQTFRVDAITGEVYIKGSIDFGDSRLLKENIIELGQQVSTGVQVPGIVQTVGSTIGVLDTSGACFWPAPTTEGNLVLIAVTTFDPDGANGGISGSPAGMTLVDDKFSTSNDTYLAVYRSTTGAIRSGSENFTFPDSVHWAINMVEVSGAKVQAAANTTSITGTGSPVEGGNIAVTGADDDFFFCATNFLKIKATGAAKGAWSNGFTALKESAGWATDIGGIPTSDPLWYLRTATKIGAGGTAADTDYTVTPVPIEWNGIMTTWAAKDAGIETPASGKVRLYNTVDRFDIPSLTTKDDTGAVRAIRDFQDIEGRLQYINDLTGGFALGAGATSQVDGMLFATTTGAGSAVADAVVANGHPGMWDLTCGTTATGLASIGAMRGATGSAFPGETGDLIRATFVVQLPGSLSSGTQRYRLAMGLMGGNDPSSVTQAGAWVSYSDTHPAIAGGGSVTNAGFTLFHGDNTDLAADPLNDGTGAVTPAGSQWARVDIEHKIGTGTSVWIDGDRKVTNFATNLAAGSTNFSIKAGIWKTIGTTSRTASIDLIAFEYIMNTPR